MDLLIRQTLEINNVLYEKNVCKNKEFLFLFFGLTLKRQTIWIKRIGVERL